MYNMYEDIFYSKINNSILRVGFYGIKKMFWLFYDISRVLNLKMLEFCISYNNYDIVLKYILSKWLNINVNLTIKYKKNICTTNHISVILVNIFTLI